MLQAQEPIRRNNEDLGITFISAAKDIDFQATDLFIVPFGLASDSNDGRDIELIAARLITAAEQGKLVVVIIGQPPVSRVPFLGEVLARELNFSFVPTGPSRPLWEAEELRVYTREYGTARTLIDIGEPPREGFQSLVRTKSSPNLVAGALRQVSEGAIYLLPANVDQSSAETMTFSLVKAVGDHWQSFGRPHTAPIVDDFVFSSEEEPLAERELLVSRLSEVEETLAGFRKNKDILFLEGRALQQRLPEWLTESFGLQTMPIEGNLEDFRLLGPGGKPVALCEVKATRSGADRDDVSAIDYHRTQHKLSNKFPGILFINTFSRAPTVKKKDKVIDRNICSWAVSRDVLVVRTLDLVRLKERLDKGSIKASSLLNALLKEHGWLHAAVNAESFRIETGRSR
jgi:hypothetical protein